MTVEEIARVCHEANRAYCKALGDDSHVAWENAPEWQRKSAMNGVRLHCENRFLGAESSHEAWLREKQEAGWVYGPVKDAEKKTHPCVRPFLDLPIEQRTKDFLFKAIVGALFDMRSFDVCLQKEQA